MDLPSGKYHMKEVSEVGSNGKGRGFLNTETAELCIGENTGLPSAEPYRGQYIILDYHQGITTAPSPSTGEQTRIAGPGNSPGPAKIIPSGRGKALHASGTPARCNYLTTQGMKLAQPRDCKILCRYNVSISLPLCRCLLVKRHWLKCRRMQHSSWSVLALLRDTAHLVPKAMASTIQ